MGEGGWGLEVVRPATDSSTRGSEDPETGADDGENGAQGGQKADPGHDSDENEDNTCGDHCCATPSVVRTHDRRGLTC